MSTKNTWRWLDDESGLPSFERMKRNPLNHRSPEEALSEAVDTCRRDRSNLENPSFRCCHCKAWVESNPDLAGVKHRNHCPLCLFSRHLDENKAGDRRSGCHAAMRPIGLTCKPSHNKYGSADGELMLVHRCLGCGKLSINRIAADDNAEALLIIFNDSGCIDGHLMEMIARQGIHLLGQHDLNIVLSRLYGSGPTAIEEIISNVSVNMPDSSDFR
ncbi:MAG: RNHCP domain-containing protein [Anaerolineaceae bacterium]|nr:RNHCP domain-containing protein [Anaerolineaceae bacterium]